MPLTITLDPFFEEMINFCKNELKCYYRHEVLDIDHVRVWMTEHLMLDLSKRSRMGGTWNPVSGFSMDLDEENGTTVSWGSIRVVAPKRNAASLFKSTLKAYGWYGKPVPMKEDA